MNAKERIKLICKYCKNPFFLQPSRVITKVKYGGKRKFCSRKCFIKAVKIRRKIIFCACGCSTKIPDVNETGNRVRFVRGHYKNSKMKIDNPLISCGCGCGKLLPKFDNKGRKREHLPHHYSINLRKEGPCPPHHQYQNLGEWKNIRNRIYERDNWTCQKCGEKCHGDIQCHHIVPYRISQNNTFENLITLCTPCHIKEEHKLNREELGTNMVKGRVPLSICPF